MRLTWRCEPPVQRALGAAPPGDPARPV